MKAEHRRELQTNVLADRIGRLIQGWKAGPSTTGWIIAGGIALAVIIVGGWWYLSNQAKKTRSHEWVQFDEAASLDELDQIIQKHPSAEAAREARFKKARYLLADGQPRLYQRGEGRTDALEKIKAAGELYEKLVKDSTDVPLLHQEALLNAGACMAMQGDFDRAGELYADLTKRYPNTPLGKEAKERADRLDAEKKLQQDLAQQADGKPSGS